MRYKSNLTSTHLIAIALTAIVNQGKKANLSQEKAVRCVWVETMSSVNFGIGNKVERVRQ